MAIHIVPCVALSSFTFFPFAGVSSCFRRIRKSWAASVTYWEIWINFSSTGPATGHFSCIILRGFPKSSQMYSQMWGQIGLSIRVCTSMKRKISSLCIPSSSYSLYLSRKAWKHLRGDIHQLLQYVNVSHWFADQMYLR